MYTWEPVHRRTLDLYSTQKPLEYWSMHRSTYTGGTNATFMGGTEIRAGRHVFPNSGVRSCLDGRSGMRSLLAILDRTNLSLLSQPHTTLRPVTCLTALSQDWEWRG